MQEKPKTLAALCLAGVIAAAAATAAPSAAAAAGKHQHGVAELNVAVEGSALELEFTSPLENLVGFEHAPRSERQRKLLQTLQERFSNPAALFAPSAAAQCSVAESTLELPGATKRQDGKAGHDDHGEHDGHAALHLSARFECKQPAELKAIELALFDTYRGLRRVKVETVTPQRQLAETLTPRKRTLAW